MKCSIKFSLVYRASDQQKFRENVLEPSETFQKYKVMWLVKLGGDLKGDIPADGSESSTKTR